MSYQNQMFAILDGDQVKLVTLDQWAQWMGTHRNERILARDEIQGYRVSTVFLGLDHQWDPRERPLYWETRIFEPAKMTRLNGKLREIGKDIYQARYSTATEARAGHAKAVAWLKVKLARNGSE